MSGPVNPHPPGETPDLLRFPTPERQRRVRIAGAVYLSIGALLLTAHGYGADGFWLFAGFIGTGVGLGLLGYRDQVSISRATRQVERRRGFFVDFRRTRFGWDHFTGIEVRRRNVLARRFSRLSGRTWESGVETRYSVVLVNGGDLEVDATADPGLARGWAVAIGAVLQLPVAPEVVAAAGEERTRRRPPAWPVWLLTLLILGALLVWIGYNLHLAERAAGS